MNYLINDFFGQCDPDFDWTVEQSDEKYKEFIKIKDERLEYIISYMKGVDVELDFSKESLQLLNNYICKQMDDAREELKAKVLQCHRYGGSPYLRSLTFDAVIYTGETIIRKNNSNTKWARKKARKKRYLGRHHPCLVKQSEEINLSWEIWINFLQFLAGVHKKTNVLMRQYETHTK